MDPPSPRPIGASSGGIQLAPSDPTRSPRPEDAPVGAETPPSTSDPTRPPDGGFNTAEIPSAKPTVAGKSLESLGLTEGQGQGQKLMLRIPSRKRMAEEGDKDVEDVGDEMDVDGADKRQERRRPKKRRVVSKEFVTDNEESATAGPRSDGWTTFESITYCEPCTYEGRECRTFVRRLRGRQRQACVRCHDQKRKCSFTTQGVSRSTSRAISRHTTEAESEEEEKEGGTVEKGKPKPKPQPRPKGKGKEKGKGKAREPSLRPREVKAEATEDEDEDMEWESGKQTFQFSSSCYLLTVRIVVHPNSAGPASGLIRRPRPRAGRIYARIRALEEHRDSLENATAERFREFQQDLDRLDSNALTQKKYFGQELARLDDQVQGLQHQGTTYQEQIDCLRRQTGDLHESLQAMQQGLSKSMEGLGTVMDRFAQLRFDLPNMLDDWGRQQFGQEPAARPTVSGAQLQQSLWGERQGPSDQPPPPHIIATLNTLGIPSGSYSADSAPHSANPPPGPTPTGSAEASPTKFYSEFIHSQPTDALIDLERQLDRTRDVGDSRRGSITSSPDGLLFCKPGIPSCSNPEPDNEARNSSEAEAPGSEGDLFSERSPSPSGDAEEESRPPNASEGEGPGSRSRSAELPPSSIPDELGQQGGFSLSALGPIWNSPLTSMAQSSPALIASPFVRPASIPPPPGLLASPTHLPPPSPSPVGFGSHLTRPDNLQVPPMTRSRSRSASVAAEELTKVTKAGKPRSRKG